MNKTRTAAKWFVGTVATAALVLGSLSMPAQAMKDTGWGKPLVSDNQMRDTGWGKP